jgi:hypothetical protein
VLGATAVPMYQVKGIGDAKLKQFVGKRVQVDGEFTEVPKGTSGPDGDLVVIQGTEMRAASGECPAK